MNDNKYQDFLEKLQNVDESERDWLVMEFSLQNLSENLRQAVTAAAIPHWFDHDFLNTILKFPLKDSDFETLINLSFVEIFPERGFNIHERSRNLLLEHLWKHNKARYQKLSKHAAAYCKKQDQSVTHWRVETIYHDLLADNMKADDNFSKQAEDWHNSFQFDKLENLTQVIFEALDSKRLTGKVGAWVAYWQAKIDIIYSRYLSAQNLLKQAIKQNGNNNFLANCIRAYGDVYLCLNEHEKDAQDCFRRALGLYRQIRNPLGEANCLLSQGKAHYYFSEYTQAMDCYQQALDIYKQIKEPLGKANCIKNLGNVSWALAKYDQALSSYQDAVVIYQQIGDFAGEANCIRSSGWVYGKQQQTELAIEKLDDAICLYETLNLKRDKASCFNDIGVIYQEEQQYEFALTAFNQAIEVFSDEIIFYQNRAVLHMKIEDYTKAEEDIKHVETAGNKNHAYTLLCRAELSLWQQQTLQAIEFSQQALDKHPANGNFRAMFALALLTDGQTEKANNEMQQALTKIYQPHDFDELFENLDKLIRIYGERPEFETMRELITSSPRYKASREIKLANTILPNSNYS